jgi:hypothetical protein
MEVLIGKSSINGPFSMAMLNNQRVLSMYLGELMVLKIMEIMGILPCFFLKLQSIHPMVSNLIFRICPIDGQ